ncbi:helix-turn-helix domain-containing protein [Ulvibacterium marinum]|uniref:AraC family transcriptional regulator n=1 Tax=Ulvibacterium marinum TaxID=2419782 RepID=A0A3B0C5Z0_9FLAO|nr:helix-turn-helix transcriptional regulator [Ulvibacterium marinum]RKN79574.1 AraC family transcriptional regulator [Ulvibacterium marinum]
MTAVFNFLMIAGAVQGFVFNIATFFSRKKIEKTILFLNLFVFFLSLNNLQSWLIDKGFVSSHGFWQDFIIPWYVLIVPMYYAFLISYLEIERKRWTFILISGGIFLLEFLTRSWVTYMVYDGVWNQHRLNDYNILEDTLTLSYSLFLFFKAYRILYKYEGLHSPILLFDNLHWLKRFMSMGGLVFVLWMTAIFFNLTGMVEQPYSYYPLRLGSSILIYWVGYQAFFQYVILKDRIVLRGVIRNKRITKGKNDQRGLPDLDRSQKEANTFKEIQTFILGEQHYLDPYLSLESLSREMNTSTSSLSKLINTYSEGNFSDYINKFRVEEAKKLLSHPDYDAYTIVAIGLECGFNSKSTFYTAFKKFTGKTPTQFRAEHS